MADLKKNWGKLEQVFYKTSQRFNKHDFENEYEFTFPVDAKYCYVFDDSHTIFVLKTGKYLVDIDGTDHQYTTLDEAKHKLWDEFKKWNL